MLRPRKLALSIAAAALLLGCNFLTDLIGGAAPTEAPPAPPALPADTPVSLPEPTDTTELPFLPVETAVGLPTPFSTSGAPVSTADWPCYRNDWDFGFTVCYPPDATLTDIPPDMARIDLPVAPGTNLGEKWLDLVVLSGAATCPPAAFPAGDPVTTLTINGQEFLRDSGADAGAGSVWEWVGYSTAMGDTCVRLTFTLRSGNPMMYDPPIPEFDPAAETAVFEAILSTFSWWG